MTEKSDIGFPNFLIAWNKLQKQGTPDIHKRLALWLERRWTRGDTRLLVMAFRAFGKSTIVGIFCTWLLWRNQDLRILVLAADLALARKMVRQVKRIVERHPLTQNLKPARAEEWGGDRFTLKRSLELRDPTMLAKGISTNLTGTRADFIICDDVEVPRNCDTAGKREDLRERLAELDYILTPDGTMMYVGTPHDWHTIYADETRIGEDTVFLEGYKRIVLPIYGRGGKSAWPERFSPEKIEQIRAKTGAAKFAGQMLCKPSNLSDGRFDASRLEIYDDDVIYHESGGEALLTIGDRKMVSGCAWWDPSFSKPGGDQSILAIVYTDTEGHFWLHHLQAIIVRHDSVIPVAHQQCQKVADIIEQYFVPRIAVETNGMGMLLPGILRRELGTRIVGCLVDDVVSRKPKNLRITEGFEVAMANRLLHVHRTVLPNSFLQELQNWNPHKKNQADDTLDAVAGALSMQPIRIKRTFSKDRQKWQSGGKVRLAKTTFEV